VAGTALACVWIKEDCCDKKLAFRQTVTSAAGVKTVSYFDSQDCTTALTGTIEEVSPPNSLADVVAAIKENKTIPAPLPVQGMVCDGSLQPAIASQAVQTVPHPDFVQNVKFCDPLPPLKIEFSETKLYSASSELGLFRIREYSEDTGVWTLRYENLDGTPFTGTLPTDLTSVTAQVNVTRTAVLGCAAGVSYYMRETARFDAETGALESELVDWVDSAGVVSAAAPAGFVLGDCPAVVPERKVLIYLERNGGVVSMADIESAVGTNKIQSVTVKQIAGTGSVSGDSGSGVPLSTGETWSWSAITGSDAWDYLGASALSLDAGSGEQRITALYIP
jgi:hypothetical protein